MCLWPPNTYVSGFQVIVTTPLPSVPTKPCLPAAVPPPPTARPPLQDAVDSLQSESEQARALREIRGRHPAFDMAPFLQSLKQDVGVVIKVCGGDLEWGGSLNGEEGYAWVPSCHPLLRK